MGGVHVASIGQADDVALVSNDPHQLQGLLHLAMEYATDHHIEKVPEKTNLLCYTPRGQQLNTTYWKDVSPVSMSGHPVPFREQAEHVGILRSTEAGNMASVLARQTAHTRAMNAVLPAGISRRHHGNPAAALRVEQMFGLPVLLSGLASLILSKAEVDTLDLHHKVQLERLQRLYAGTPAPVVYFLAGTLPASAHLHLHQLSLLGMIARLGTESILHRHGCYMLSSPSPSPSSFSSSWFTKIRGICQQYSLPDPFFVLHYPETKERWKTATKLRVTEYWGKKLREQANSLGSLSLFRATHMSLPHPSPTWTSCRDQPYEVRKATVQARMASGRYRTCWFRRHYAGDSTGMCRVPGCTGDTPGTLAHLATGQCPGLTDAVAAATSHWVKYLTHHVILQPIVKEFVDASQEEFLGFLLHPPSQPRVIALAQQHGRDVVDALCYLTRTWLYRLHRERFKKLGLWNP